MILSTPSKPWRVEQLMSRPYYSTCWLLGQIFVRQERAVLDLLEVTENEVKHATLELVEHDESTPSAYHAEHRRLSIEAAITRQ